MEIFKEETLQMLLLAKAANIPIFLKIHEKLLSLLSSDIYKEYFNNNKENFKKLYENVSLYINTTNSSYNVLEDNSAFLRNKNNLKINIYKISNEQRDILVSSVNPYIVFDPIKDANNSYFISENEYYYIYLYF